MRNGKRNVLINSYFFSIFYTRSDPVAKKGSETINTWEKEEPKIPKMNLPIKRMQLCTIQWDHHYIILFKKWYKFFYHHRRCDVCWLWIWPSLLVTLFTSLLIISSYQSHCVDRWTFLTSQSRARRDWLAQVTKLAFMPKERLQPVQQPNYYITFAVII